jgi:quercetin dioxygenase-like cupin family protein
MSMHRYLLPAMLATSLFTAYTLPAVADEPSTTQVLLKSSNSWDGTPYQSYPQSAPELTVLKIAIAPHSKLPWHTHPVPNAAYVLSGELIVERKSDGKTMTVKAGEALPETVDIVHRGTTGDAGAVLIVFYAGTAGTAVTKKEP